MNYGVIILRIKLTAVTSFDFDYIRPRRLLIFFLPNGVLIRVNTVAEKNGIPNRVLGLLS